MKCPLSNPHSNMACLPIALLFQFLVTATLINCNISWIKKQHKFSATKNIKECRGIAKPNFETSASADCNVLA